MIYKYVSGYDDRGFKKTKLIVAIGAEKLQDRNGSQR